MAAAKSHGFDGIFLSIACVNEKCDYCTIAIKGDETSKIKKCPICKSKLTVEVIHDL